MSLSSKTVNILFCKYEKVSTFQTNKRQVLPSIISISVMNVYRSWNWYLISESFSASRILKIMRSQFWSLHRGSWISEGQRLMGSEIKPIFAGLTKYTMTLRNRMFKNKLNNINVYNFFAIRISIRSIIIITNQTSCKHTKYIESAILFAQTHHPLKFCLDGLVIWISRHSTQSFAL